MIYFFTLQFFEHFILSYYSMNAVQIIETMGYGNQPVLAYSIPALMMLGRLYAVKKLAKWQDAGVFFTQSISLMTLGALFMVGAMHIPYESFNLAIFIAGLLFLNISLTWSDWYMNETTINNPHYPRFSQAARLSNLSMFGIVCAMIITELTSPQNVYLMISIVAVILWLSQPHMYFKRISIKSSQLFQLPLACHIGLSYTTFTVPFVLFRYWAPQINSIYNERITDIALMIMDILIMILIAKWAKKYHKKNHLLLLPALIGCSYFLCISTAPIATYAMSVVYKILMIVLGCYYALIVSEKTYLLQSDLGKKNSMENWVGKTLFGKLWLPTTLFIWQSHQITTLIALWVALPAIITWMTELRDNSYRNCSGHPVTS